MIAISVYWAVVAVWTVLALTRARSRVSRAPEERPMLIVRTAFRPARFTDLSRVRRVVLVTVSLLGSTSCRALLVDGSGRLLARPRHHRGLWQRDDTEALLHAAGISVEWDHRRTRPVDIEAEYPGATRWIERHAVAYFLTMVAGVSAGIGIIMWFFLA